MGQLGDQYIQGDSDPILNQHLIEEKNGNQPNILRLVSADSVPQAKYVTE